MRKKAHDSRLQLRKTKLRRLGEQPLKAIAGGDVYFEPDTTGDDGYGHTCNCATGYCQFR